MPSLLSLNALRSQVLERAQSGNKLTPEEAQQIIANNGGPLDAAQRAVVQTLIAQPSLYDGDDARRQVSATLGVYVPPALPGVAGELEEQLLKAITELPGKNLFKNRPLHLAEFSESAPVGGGTGRAGVRADVEFQPLPPTDPEVQARRAITERLEAGGDTAAWVKTGGGAFPTAGFNASLPLPGGASLSFGFDANASLRTESLYPYVLDTDSLRAAGRTAAEVAVDLAKNTTVGMPFSARNALAMPEGARFRIEGHGQLAVNTGVGLGRQLQLANGLVTLGAGVSVGTGLSHSGNVALTVDRLDESKVMVSLDFAKTRSNSVNGSVNVGLTVALDTLVPGSVSGVFRKGAELVTDAVESEVNKWTTFSAGASARSWDTTETKRRYVFDLSNPDAQLAFERLMRLNVGSADAASTLDSSGVTMARLDATTTGRATSADIRLGSLNLLKAIAQRTTNEGTVNDSAGRSITWTRGRLERGYSGLISDIFRGARSASADFVTTEQDGTRNSYLRITHSITDDQRTTGADLQKFLELRTALDAAGDTPAALQAARDRNSNIGKSTRRLDAYIDDAGLQALANVSADQLKETYAGALKQLEMKPTDTVPWLITDARAGEVMEWLTKPVLSQGGDSSSQNDITDYWRATRRNLPDDRQLYQAWRRFEGRVEKMRTATTPRQRVEAFTGTRLPLDPTVELATLAKLAGNEHVLLANLSMNASNSAMSVSYQSEGSIADPAGAVGGVLAAAGRT